MGFTPAGPLCIIDMIVPDLHCREHTGVRKAIEQLIEQLCVQGRRATPTRNNLKCVSALLYSLGILARMEPPCLRKSAEPCYTSLVPSALSPAVVWHAESERLRHESAPTVMMCAIWRLLWRGMCGNDIPSLVAPVNRTWETVPSMGWIRENPTSAGICSGCSFWNRFCEGGEYVRPL